MPTRRGPRRRAPAKQRSCLDCGQDLTGAHANRKRCGPCALARVERPSHSLTPTQQRRVLALAGRLQAPQLAQRLGVTRANLTRFARDRGLSLRKPLYDSALIGRVLRFYEAHGQEATQRHFPGVRVRSVVERHQHAPRQSRWTPEQIVQAAQMAGLVPLPVQAAVFARPGAHAGSIVKLWHGKLRICPSHIHGLSPSQARFLLLPEAPMTEVLYSASCRRASNRLVLWCDAVRYIRPDVPKFLVDALLCMARFQCWLFQSERPDERIGEMLAAVQTVTAQRPGQAPRTGTAP